MGRYIIARVFGGVLIALIGVLACILLIDLVEQMRTVGTRTDISLLDALRLTLLKTPMLVEQTLPFVVLAGTMGAIIALNRGSELVAMRAAGISAWRFLTPSAFVGIVLGVIAVTALNPLGAFLYQQFEAEKQDALSQTLSASGENGVWIRQGDDEGQVVIHARSVDPSGTRLQGATFMFFEVQQDALRFTRRIQAATAELKPGFWQLTDLTEATPGGRPVRQTHLAIPTTLDATELINRFVNPATLSFWACRPSSGSQGGGLCPDPLRTEAPVPALPLLLATMAGLSGILARAKRIWPWGAAAGVGIGLFLPARGAFAIPNRCRLGRRLSAPLAGCSLRSPWSPSSRTAEEPQAG
jgi:lipopolysaccharide export system permease protein